MPEGDASHPTGNGTSNDGGLAVGSRPPTGQEIRTWLQQNEVSRFQIAQELTTMLAAANKRAEELESRVAPAGAVVLTGDDATRWAAFRDLGLAPDDVKAAVTERDTLRAQSAQRERAAKVMADAEAAGYAPKLVERLSRDPDAAFEVVAVADVERDGKPAGKVLQVRRAGTQDEPTDLDAYAATHFAEFAPALRATGAPTGTPATPARPAAPAYPAAPLTTANGGTAPTSEQQRAAVAARVGAFV